MNEWNPVSEQPKGEGAYLVFMPDRSLDQFSVQHWDDIDGWANDFGSSHWRHLPEPPNDD